MEKEVYKISGNDAANYEEHLGPLIFEPSARALLPHIAGLPASAVLELACGSGRLTRHLREAFPPPATLTATDINPDMLELAQQLPDNDAIIFQLADAQQLPFSDASFDLVINQFGLMFLPDKQGGVNEAFRVLKPGGHFAFTTWDQTAAMPLFKLLIDEIIIPVFSGEDTSRFHTPFALHEPGQLGHYLHQAGFTTTHIIPLKYKGQATSPQQLVTSYFLQHPLGRQVKEKAPASFDTIARQLEQGLIQQFGAGAFEFELSAWAGIGQK
ncbi:class I SAM-dependent methyltransferase [Chitinophaga sp. Mgbs1]|uniref:Class I SAM-dependent methyltransferase n=1 Tax=Chitinophaga solisilvae TaxID=1233460 RepID=A0A9Q5D3V9_9BACT|nr:class I SAM-dependent methyltransferase [Chitinophaga solisilvae]